MDVLSSLGGNQFATGGIVVVLLGGLLAYFKTVPMHIYRLILRRFTINLEIHSTSDVFHWLEKWLYDSQYIQKSCKDLIVRTSRNNDILLVPGYGFHFFFYKKHPVFLSLAKEETKGGDGYAPFKEICNIRFICKNKSLINEFIETIKSNYILSQYTETKIYTQDYVHWRTTINRPLSKGIPILQNGLYSSLCDDLENFINSSQKYDELCIHFKRNYLLYGPPGNGKTTSILALAQKIKKHICIISLSDSSLTDSNLVQLIGNMPSDSILCLEDIDCLSSTQDRESDKSDKEPKVTLGNLLNLLDGLYTPHGLIVFLTTNHIENLDPALVRSGRMDMKVEFKNANEEQIRTACEKFNIICSEEIISHLLGKPMCDIQEYLRNIK